MKTSIALFLLVCVVGGDDIRWEFQQFKSQLEAQYAAKFSELDSRLSTCETKMTDQSSYEQFQDKLNLLTEQQDCLKKKLCERDGFTYGDGLCYYISTERKSWDDSRQWCRDRQSDLIIIKSKEKQDLVASFNKWVWLGLTDKVTEGLFQWVDGTPLTTPTYWWGGEPEAETRAYPNAELDCVYTQSSVSGWVDSQCSVARNWMCERSLC